MIGANSDNRLAIFMAKCHNGPEFDALVTRAMLEAVRRRQDRLPGLAAALPNELVDCNGWLRRACSFPRVTCRRFVQANVRESDPWFGLEEALLTMAVHGSAHVWAKIHGISDRSGNGRYHNARFRDLALTLGLQVQKDRHLGHRTPHLSGKGRYDYADLLRELRHGLKVLAANGPDKPSEER
ncbi:hypothetical protein DMH04_25535 [Kibdelosporangium aridum]|uniref:Uncharacterized protein n=1 Tax=Kibdelosporangium aridum TaxID=2030 RepID=A0A428Z640_KIBAR|nr:hypothetical protein [Kibdelosporangium aridum]RSM82557.1 hypothetical protein DMH04_25535 [Kibdelosporangium aridum]